MLIDQDKVEITSKLKLSAMKSLAQDVNVSQM